MPGIFFSLGLTDDFGGVQGNAIVGAGMTIGAGFVVDWDSPWESGPYASIGVGMGYDISIGGGGGWTSEHEGAAGALNGGAGPVAASIITSTDKFGDYLKDVVAQGRQHQSRQNVGVPKKCQAFS